MSEGRLDPVTLSVLASALSGVAEEMGAVLIRGAYSSNIKERRDCSAGLFDERGKMVAQAEHIPVHLGAMPEAVRAVMDKNPEPDDIFAINDPYSGGTHLPDITLVSPLAHEGEIIGYAVTRAHHSDVGGMSPGSMPSDSHEIYQEGIIIPPTRLVRGGEYVQDVLDLLLANVRTPDLRRGDLRAQIAANNIAEERIEELMERRGKDVVLTAFEEVISYAEKRACEAIRDLPDGEYTAEDYMEGDGVIDEDIPIKATVAIKEDSMTIDFAGTADAVEGNVNCPLPVTRSSCYFALRVLLPGDIPANAGTYAPLEIKAPEGSLLNATYPSAVVAGNVETSNRIADTVLAAFSNFAPEKLPAQGQGTMNNTIIGGGGWTYYETIGGGQGASEKGSGPSGVHTSMTNTMNTPIEAFEMEYPMRVERYELLYDSGGSGKHRGGDGIVRSVRVLDPASLSLLTDRRRHPPQGAQGGEPGAVGENLL
ncbi:MAG: hydantoinase B/oxoprolinase family protein, partial [Actinomycetota bacterium]|nr:hydantoinase B/oxoprolinase family protein [Actinomycetota bacterium]